MNKFGWFDLNVALLNTSDVFIPTWLRFKFPNNAADNDNERILCEDHSYLSNTIRANRMGWFVMQMAVHYLLNSDFRFTLLIKFKFIDFVVHLLHNFAEER